MALTIVDPSVVQAISNTEARWINATNPQPTPVRFDGNLSSISDSIDLPVFDQGHVTYTSLPQNQASASFVADNTRGDLPLTFSPTLSYTYSSGYSTSHEQSKGISATVTQDFDFKFAGAGEGTTLSATGSLNWSDSTGTDDVKSITEGVVATVEVPAGKKYLLQGTFDQLSAKVDFTTTAHLDGGTNFVSDPNSGAWVGIGDQWYDLTTRNSIKVTLPVLPNVDWNDFRIPDRPYDPEFPRPYLDYTLSGSLTVEAAGQFTTSAGPVVKIYDVTNGGSQAVQAEYDPSTPVGVYRTMDDSGREFGDTPFDDRMDGGAGADTILLTGGEDVAYGNGGDDVIRAEGVGRSLLDGGAGNDVLLLSSCASGSALVGGDGDDRIFAYAPNSQIFGGSGDDLFVLRQDSAHGAVIVDAEGTNNLWIDAQVPLRFERIAESDDLYILLGDGTYDRARDVAWVDFFADSGNEVDGMTAEQIAGLATTYRGGVAVSDHVLA